MADDEIAVDQSPDKPTQSPEEGAAQDDDVAPHDLGDEAPPHLGDEAPPDRGDETLPDLGDEAPEDLEDKVPHDIGDETPDDIKDETEPVGGDGETMEVDKSIVPSIDPDNSPEVITIEDDADEEEAGKEKSQSEAAVPAAGTDTSIYTYKGGFLRVTVYPVSAKDLENRKPLMAELLGKCCFYSLRFVEVNSAKMGFLLLKFRSYDDAREAFNAVRSDDGSLKAKACFTNDIPDEEIAKLCKMELSNKSNCTVLVKNLPSDVRREMLEILYPTAKNIEIPVDSSRSLGYAMLDFATPEEAADISFRSKHDQPCIGQNTLVVIGILKEPGQAAEPTTMIAKNVPPGIGKELQEKSLAKLFKSATSIEIHCNSDDTCRYVLLHIATKAEAERVLSRRNSLKLGGKTVSLSIKSPGQEEPTWSTLEEEEREELDKIDLKASPGITKVLVSNLRTRVKKRYQRYVLKGVFKSSIRLEIHTNSNDTSRHAVVNFCTKAEAEEAVARVKSDPKLLESLGVSIGICIQGSADEPVLEDEEQKKVDQVDLTGPDEPVSDEDKQMEVDKDKQMEVDKDKQMEVDKDKQMEVDKDDLTGPKVMTTVFVNNVPSDAQTEMLQSLYPTAVNIQIPGDKVHCLGYALVDFSTVEEAETVVANSLTQPARHGNKVLKLHIIGQGGTQGQKQSVIERHTTAGKPNGTGLKQKQSPKGRFHDYASPVIGQPKEGAGKQQIGKAQVKGQGNASTKSGQDEKTQQSSRLHPAIATSVTVTGMGTKSVRRGKRNKARQRPTRNVREIAKKRPAQATSHPSSAQKLQRLDESFVRGPVVGPRINTSRAVGPRARIVPGGMGGVNRMMPMSGIRQLNQLQTGMRRIGPLAGLRTGIIPIRPPGPLRSGMGGRPLQQIRPPGVPQARIGVFGPPLGGPQAGLDGNVTRRASRWDTTQELDQSRLGPFPHQSPPSHFAVGQRWSGPSTTHFETDMRLSPRQQSRSPDRLQRERSQFETSLSDDRRGARDNVSPRNRGYSRSPDRSGIPRSYPGRDSPISRERLFSGGSRARYEASPGRGDDRSRYKTSRGHADDRSRYETSPGRGDDRSRYETSRSRSDRGDWNDGRKSRSRQDMGSARAGSRGQRLQQMDGNRLPDSEEALSHMSGRDGGEDKAEIDLLKGQLLIQLRNLEDGNVTNASALSNLAMKLKQLQKKQTNRESTNVEQSSQINRGNRQKTRERDISRDGDRRGNKPPPPPGRAVVEYGDMMAPNTSQSAGAPEMISVDYGHHHANMVSTNVPPSRGNFQQLGQASNQQNIINPFHQQSTNPAFQQQQQQQQLGNYPAGNMFTGNVALAYNQQPSSMASNIPLNALPLMGSNTANLPTMVPPPQQANIGYQQTLANFGMQQPVSLVPQHTLIGNQQLANFDNQQLANLDNQQLANLSNQQLPSFGNQQQIRFGNQQQASFSDQIPTGVPPPASTFGNAMVQQSMGQFGMDGIARNQQSYTRMSGTAQTGNDSLTSYVDNFKNQMSHMAPRVSQKADNNQPDDADRSVNKKVFVRNLPAGVTNDELQVFFNKTMYDRHLAENPDSVASAYYIKNTMYGFVTFHHPALATRAIKLDGVLFRNSRLVVRRPAKYVNPT